MMRNSDDSNATDWMAVSGHDVMTGIAGSHNYSEKLAIHATYYKQRRSPMTMCTHICAC